MLSNMKACTRQIQATFDRFDEDGSGELDLEEVVKAFQQMGVAGAMTDDEIQHLFEEHDQDGSGFIDCAEFAEMVESGLRWVLRGGLEVRPPLHAQLMVVEFY
jgi:Ca2+-binding EF-hand superfamily protein